MGLYLKIIPTQQAKRPCSAVIVVYIVCYLLAPTNRTSAKTYSVTVKIQPTVQIKSTVTRVAPRHFISLHKVKLYCEEL